MMYFPMGRSCLLPVHLQAGGSSLVNRLLLIIISIQPLGQFGQEPEPSQATGMALVRCILAKFLGVVCHCLPLCLDFPLLPPSTSMSSTMQEILAAKGGTMGKKGCLVILPTWRLYSHH